MTKKKPKPIYWIDSEVKPKFRHYIFVEYGFTSSRGGHFEVGEIESLWLDENDFWFIPKEGEDREHIEWKYVRKWIYLEDLDKLLREK